MLNYLFELLDKFDFPGKGLMNYLSFRAMLASVISILVAILFGKKVIAFLQRKQIGETIRDLGLEGQMSKKGTPTMGGVIIIVSLLTAVLLVCDLSNIYVQLLMLTTIWCGALGFSTIIDEQTQEETVINENIVKTTTTTIPFVKDHEFDYKSLSPFKGALGWYCKWAIYALVIIFIILACSNGANLTDGMDGLSAGTSAIVGVVLGILAWLGGNVINSTYLNIMFIPGSGEIAVFMAAFVGALGGFLWYNTFPAQVFMGDTGSLTIGGIIGVTAVLLRKELLLPVLCGLFLVESLSVILQRGYFKYTKKKYGTAKRLFRMAPIHHHFQKEGLPEPRIVTRFWLVGILLAVSTLALLKIR